VFNSTISTSSLACSVSVSFPAGFSPSIVTVLLIKPVPAGIPLLVISAAKTV